MGHEDRLEPNLGALSDVGEALEKGLFEEGIPG